MKNEMVAFGSNVMFSQYNERLTNCFSSRGDLLKYHVVICCYCKWFIDVRSVSAYEDMSHQSLLHNSASICRSLGGGDSVSGGSGGHRTIERWHATW